MTPDPDEATLRQHGADFVLVLLEQAEAWQADRQRFLNLVSLRLQKREDLSSDARDTVFKCARQLAERLPVTLVTSSDVSAAHKLCLQTAHDLTSPRHELTLSAVMTRWPAIIAHEVERLLAAVKEGTAYGNQPSAPSPEAALWQFMDVTQVLIKFPALVLGRVLIERGASDDGHFARAALFGQLSLGSWLGFARAAAQRVDKAAHLPHLHGLAGLFKTSSIFYQALDRFVQVRNDEIGHGAHRVDPEETAGIVRALVVGDATLAARLRLSKDKSQAIISLADALDKAVEADPWARMRLFAGDNAAPVSLMGVGDLANWLASADNAPNEHHSIELPVRLAFDDGWELDLGPFVRARICTKCDHRDLFLYDSLYNDRDAGTFDLIDYGRGHKTRRPGHETPDLTTALKSAGPVTVQTVEGSLSSRDVVERLDAARVEQNYISPAYLRSPLAAFLREFDRGVYWLRSPAHVGKTTFVHGLMPGSLGDGPLIGGTDPASVAIAAFFCKREYRTGAETFLNGLERAIETALDLRQDLSEPRPDIRDVTRAADRRRAFVAWIDAWRHIASRQHHRGLPRLLVAIDGLDEADPPDREGSLLHFLPSPEELTPGLYVLITSRRPQDVDCPGWLGSALEDRLAGRTGAVIRTIGLEDPTYRALLRQFVAFRLGRSSRNKEDKAFEELFARTVEKAEGRFVYVSFLVDRLLRGTLPVDQLGQAQVGDGLYREFLDRLDTDSHPKLADAIREILLVLTAEERAHDWIFGEGVLTDRATGGVLAPEPTHWTGVPLGRLAEITTQDIRHPDGTLAYDARFVNVLLALQGVLAISRADISDARYRIGLKGLTDQVSTHPAFEGHLAREHAHLATLTLDAMDALASDPDRDHETTESMAEPRKVFTEGCPHVLAHLRLSGSEILQARWDARRASELCASDVEDARDHGRYVDAMARQALILSWFEDELRRTADGASPTQRRALKLDLARGYADLGIYRQRKAGPAVAVRNYDVAIKLMEEVRGDAGADWATPCQEDLAHAYALRAGAKGSAPDHGPAAALADYDAAIRIRERLRDDLGADWPVGWRQDLATTYDSRGCTKVDAPEHGPTAALVDHDAAIQLMERVRSDLGQDWVIMINWRHELAAAYGNRGNAKQHAPGHGPGAALVDYDLAVGLLERLREDLGPDWPVPWRTQLAMAYGNRGNAKQIAPDHGPAAALVDYNVAVDLLERLREDVGPDWSDPDRRQLAKAYKDRGSAKLDAPGYGPAAALADYDAAIQLMMGLRDELGLNWPIHWREDLAVAYGNRGRAKVDAPGYGFTAALADYDLAIELMQRLREDLGPDWPTSWRYHLVLAFHNRALIKQDVPDHELLSAIDDLVTSIEVMWRQHDREALAHAYEQRGRTLRAIGRDSEAQRDLDTAREIRERLGRSAGT